MLFMNMVLYGRGTAEKLCVKNIICLKKRSFLYTKYTLYLWFYSCAKRIKSVTWHSFNYLCMWSLGYIYVSNNYTVKGSLRFATEKEVKPSVHMQTLNFFWHNIVNFNSVWLCLGTYVHDGIGTRGKLHFDLLLSVSITCALFN